MTRLFLLIHPHALIIIFLLLSFTHPYALHAQQPEAWYRIMDGPQYQVRKCAKDPDGPLMYIRNDNMVNVPYHMKDVNENGVVVQTTMTSASLQHMGRLGLDGLDTSGTATWYRGQARCEQALTTQQRAEEAARKELLKKYR